VLVKQQLRARATADCGAPLATQHSPLATAQRCGGGGGGTAAGSSAAQTNSK